jgi:pyrimidine-nucleoside phosphorylase
MPEMHVPTVIEKKREGKELTDDEISQLVSGFASGEVADSQVSAWAMAVFFQGMTPAETHHLTKAMMESGSVLDYPAGAPPKVDKHSTGGIGDKVSLVLAPLLACDGVWVPMISGRGLGISGGTLDKLESIPGFNIHIDERRALAQLESIGVFIIGQNADICPAGRKLSALREVTATVPSQPLMVASVMSKKLAANLDRLVLDVKYGNGSFLKTRKEAKQLAASMTKVGKLMGIKVSHLLSPMDEPLGRAVGNALEVAECVEVLQGGGPPDLVDRVLDLAEQVSTEPRTNLARWLSDGTAWRKFISLVYAQDGDASSLEKITELHRAPIIHPIVAQKGGTVRKMDAEIIGQVSLLLGAGREKVDDTIDCDVGLSGIKKIGERVEAEEPLLFIHARSEGTLDLVLPLLEKAIAIN